MSESKGFSNVLFTMLNDDKNASTPIKGDTLRLSIESTPITTPIAGEKRLTVSNFLTKDLMRKLEETSPVKAFDDDEFGKKLNLFSPSKLSEISYTSFITANKFNYQFKKSDISANSTPSDIEAEEKSIMFGKQGWFCVFCKNFNYESKLLFNLVRIKCNRCGKTPLVEKNNCVVRQLTFNEAQSKPVVIEKKKPFQERAGDWTCAKCRNLNFSFRVVCNRCQLSKNESSKINEEKNIE
jgi:hypothetical protein